MIKRYMKLLVGLLIVAVIAIAAYIGVTVYKNNESKRLAEEELKKVIFDFDTNDIKGIKIQNSSGNFRFDIKGESWTIVEGENLQLNTYKLANISNTMSSLTASRVLEENLPDDLSEYGLDGHMIIDVIMNDGSEKSLEMGRQVPGSTDYYAMMTGGNMIYVISQSDAETIITEKSDLKDKYLFDVSSTSEVDYLRYIEGGNVIYDLRKNDDAWTLFNPFPQGKVNGAEVTSVLSELIRVQCATFVDEEMLDLAKFGFDNPKYQLDIRAGSREAGLIFGNYYDEKEQYIYAYNKEIDQIYIFETASLGFIGTKTEDMLIRTIHSEFFGDIKSFDIDIFGTEINIKYQYSVAGEGETYYSVNGKKVDNENDEILEAFNSLINSITGMSFEKIAENVNAAELRKEPDASIVYHLKDGEDYKLEFIQTSDDENYYYIIENGAYIDVLARKYVLESGILKYYKDLMDLMKNG